MEKKVKRIDIQYKSRIIDSEGHVVKRNLKSTNLINAIQEAVNLYNKEQSEYEEPRDIEYLTIRKRYRVGYDDGSTSKLNKYASGVYSRDLITKNRIAPNRFGERTPENATRFSLFPNNEFKKIKILNNEDMLCTPAEEDLANKLQQNEQICI